MDNEALATKHVWDNMAVITWAYCGSGKTLHNTKVMDVQQKLTYHSNNVK